MTGIKRTITCRRPTTNLDPLLRAWKNFPSNTPPADNQPNTPDSPLNGMLGGRWGKMIKWDAITQDPGAAEWRRAALSDNTERIWYSYGGFTPQGGDQEFGPARLETAAQFLGWSAAFDDDLARISFEEFSRNPSYDQVKFPDYNIARSISQLGLAGSGLDDAPPPEYEFYDFSTDAPYAKTYLLDEILDSLREGREGGYKIKSAATINPEYNFFSEKYETAIASSGVPEAVLPNMYIYSFMSDNNDNLSRPDWQNGEREAELTGRNYDRLITLEEFSGEILPRLNSEDNGFEENYLENYANAVDNVIIDFTSSLARDFRTTISPASEMNFYDSLNNRKTQFPMYIELTIPTFSVLENSITHMMGTSTTSTGMLNSLVSTPSTNQTFNCSSTFFKDTNSVRDQQRAVLISYLAPDFDARTNQNNQSVSIKTTQLEEPVYDFDEWMNGVMDDIETMVVSPDGRERVMGQCARFRDRMMVQAMRNNISSLARSNAPSYTDMISGKLCKNETIAYKLIKKNSRDQIIQTFYLPNTSYTDTIKFVDTQVKYNKNYKYDLKAYAVVYGSKYVFRTRERTYPAFGENENFQRPASDPVYFVFDVETIPNPKVVEYTIFSDSYKVQTDTFLSSGVSFPLVKVLDRPPMPPEMQVIPYRNNYQQVLINIQPGSGARLGQDAVDFIFLDEDDLGGTTGRNAIAVHQKQFENFDLIAPKLEFKSESAAETKRVEIYRTTEMPLNVEKYNDAYRSFGSVAHKVLDISQNEELPEEEVAEAFDCIDDLDPNITYYYTCRTIDVHNKKSNPSAIYQVKLNYEGGVYYPTIEAYQPSMEDRKSPTKPMARFLEVKASDLQSYVYNSLDDDGNVVSERGVVSESRDQVQNNHFLVRVTSKDTGRKFEINLVFHKGEISD